MDENGQSDPQSKTQPKKEDETSGDIGRSDETLPILALCYMTRLALWNRLYRLLIKSWALLEAVYSWPDAEEEVKGQRTNGTKMLTANFKTSKF